MGAKTKTYVPYRESKLTRLLQDSLGKNSNTWVISTLSPDIEAFEDTINTLKFTDNAMKILVDAPKETGETPESGKIHELQKEVNYLKDLLKLKNSKNQDQVHQQLYVLKKENLKLKQLVSSSLDLTKTSSSKPLTLKNLVSSARGIGGEGLESYDPTRADGTGAGTFREPTHNNRYSDANQTPTTFPEGLDNKITNTQTTSLGSQDLNGFSNGRSSSGLQFAGAKILAGTYSRKQAGSVPREDNIPVRIRSQKKIGMCFHNKL